MEKDLQKARELLNELGCTCVLCLHKETVTSDRRGVAPLLDLLDSGRDFSGFYAADKVVGKATAFLYCLLGVRGVYAPVMSIAAVRVLTDHGISVSCDRLVEGIRNRTDTGPCPMEAATGEIEDAAAALVAIRQTLGTLQH